MRKRGELGTVQMKVITPGKIVPHKCCLPSLNISVKRILTQTFILTNTVTHFQVLSVMPGSDCKIFLSVKMLTVSD